MPRVDRFHQTNFQNSLNSKSYRCSFSSTMGGKCSTSADANPCVDLFECKIPRDPASEDAAAVGVCPPALSRARTHRVPPNSVTHAERVVRACTQRAPQLTHNAPMSSMRSPPLPPVLPVSSRRCSPHCNPQPAPPPAHTPQRFSFWNLANRHTQLPYLLTPPTNDCSNSDGTNAMLTHTIDTPSRPPRQHRCGEEAAQAVHGQGHGVLYQPGRFQRTRRGHLCRRRRPPLRRRAGRHLCRVRHRRQIADERARCHLRVRHCLRRLRRGQGWRCVHTPLWSPHDGGSWGSWSCGRRLSRLCVPFTTRTSRSRDTATPHPVVASLRTHTCVVFSLSRHTLLGPPLRPQTFN